MMQLKNGVDIVSIERIARSMQEPRFLPHCFTAEECRYFAERQNAPQTVAAHFAAKEAFAKALGYGIRGFALKDVAVHHTELGTPYLVLTGKAAELAEGRQTALSLSHDAGVAIAFVTLWQE